MWGPSGAVLCPGCTYSPDILHAAPDSATGRRNPENKNKRALKNNNRQLDVIKKWKKVYHKTHCTWSTSVWRLATYFWDAMWKKVRPTHRLWSGLLGWVLKAWTYWPEDIEDVREWLLDDRQKHVYRCKQAVWKSIFNCPSIMISNQLVFTRYTF